MGAVRASPNAAPGRRRAQAAERWPRGRRAGTIAPCMPLELAVEPHPLLALAAFTCELPAPLGELPSPSWLTALLALEAETPVQRDESVRETIRKLLRHGGYKPTGRGKPSSEYL